MLWVLIVGLLLVAWLFVLYPFVGKQQADTEGDLEANLRIFRDHQSQLDDQLNSQQIDQEQYQQLIAEAQQLLLRNTEQVRSEQSSGDKSKGDFGYCPCC